MLFQISRAKLGEVVTEKLTLIEGQTPEAALFEYFRIERLKFNWKGYDLYRSSAHCTMEDDIQYSSNRYTEEK